MNGFRKWLGSGSWPATITGLVLVMGLVLLSPVLIPLVWAAYFVVQACHWVLDWYETHRGDGLARQIRWQIDTQYGNADSLLRRAWWAEKIGLHQAAHRMRHDARQALRMAIKMQRGLDTGVYRIGHRQFPAVEDMCGCDRYCRRRS